MKSIVEKCVCMYSLYSQTFRGAFWYNIIDSRLMQLRKPIPRLDVKGWMVEWVAVVVNTDIVESQILVLEFILRRVANIEWRQKYLRKRISSKILVSTNVIFLISNILLYTMWKEMYANRGIRQTLIKSYNNGSCEKIFLLSLNKTFGSK